MKKFIIFFLMTSAISLLAQEQKPVLPIDPETHQIKFQEVVNEKGSKQELFNRCVYWLYKYYKDADRITSVRDPNTGKIVGQHRFRVYYYDKDSIRRIGGTIDYTFTIEFKKDRYRYIVNKLLLKTASKFPIERWLDKKSPNYDPRWESYLNQIADFVKSWEENLKEHMRPEPVKKPNDNW